ncbi:hypothetical protein K449DRAFT_470757 [Hypoxylon sp. EC38]|nr:hypothetical protein K449DRAFT_470757 [Hypoxylon sp. EC38]
MATFQNILLVSSSGAFGTVLLNEPQAQLKTIIIPDSYPTRNLIAAFEGQDVIINSMTTFSVSDHEYGLDNTSPEAQALNVVFHDKGMRVRERKFTFWDNGDGCFACTTEENTAAGLLLAAIETIQGVKYATETINSEYFIEEKHEAVEKGDKLATFVLIEIGFIMGRFGGHLEEELPSNSVPPLIALERTPVQNDHRYDARLVSPRPAEVHLPVYR